MRWMQASVFLWVGATIFCSGVAAQEVSVPQSTQADRKNIAITVYNQDLALIREVRSIHSQKGTWPLRFMDVPATVMPETVLAKPIKSDAPFSILEQNYEFDLMSQQKILDKYEGKQIELVEFNQYQDRKNTVSATVLSSTEQIYQVGQDIYLGYPGYKVVKQIPDNLIARPTLNWLYQSSVAGDIDMEAAYLARGMKWTTDYVLALEPDDKTAAFTGWVTITNQTGTSFKDVKLKLIAGDINRAAQTPAYDKAMMVRAMAMESAAPQFQEKGFADYHLYSLQRPADLSNNQSKQIQLCSADNVKIEKQYWVRGQQYYFTQSFAGQDPKIPVEVIVRMKNENQNNLGIPIPQGVVRMYQKDADTGAMEFIGEDRVDHTPKNEWISLKTGSAFDVVCERKQSDYRIINSRTHVSEWQITLRNQKQQAVKVSVSEPMYGEWKIYDNSHPFVKENAQSARFDIDVPAGKEVVLRYKVSIEFR